jgi:GNAT superfamily N-acetyltransferase
MLERADLLTDAGGDGFDALADWVGVFDNRAVVGWALVDERRRATADVHPDARGNGIGTWLRRWTEDRAKALGVPLVTQIVDDARSEVRAMLTAAGYAPRGTSWILRMDHPKRPLEPEPPAGIELRPFRSSDEEEALAMFERAFSEFEDRTQSSPGTWRALVTRREGFEPDDLVLAFADERIVGGAFLIDADDIWVDKLAVAREFRHRGIARALLRTAFVRSHDRGYSWTSLSTDSRTGALSLYERIGMTIHRSFTRYGLDL